MLKKYVKESIKILGVHFGRNAQNLNEIMVGRKMDHEFEKWKDRNLSMNGKITILRTLILSKIWHVGRVTGLQKKFIQKTTSEMTKFFWHPKTFHCINLKTLQNEPNKGGLNFPDLELEINAYFLETIPTAINHEDGQRGC